MPQHRDRLVLLLMVAALTAMSAPAWQAAYYMRDEFQMVLDTPPTLLGTLYIGLVLGWKNARPLAYPFYGVYAAVDALGGFSWIRVSQLAMSIAAAVFLFHILRRRGLSAPWAGGLVLFIWSQPTIMIYSAYAPMAPYWVGVAGGWLAFLLLYDATPGGPMHRRQLFVAALLLFAGWLTFQAAPFGVLVPASYFALTATPAAWATDRRKHATAFALLGVTLVLYTLFTKLTVALAGANLTSPVRRAFALLSGAPLVEYQRLLDPVTLLEPFEWWNYWAPTTALAIPRFLQLTALSAFAWMAVCAAAFRIERARGDRRFTCERYAVALAAAGVTYLPVVLEGLTGLERQHVFVAFVPVVVLTAAHAIGIVAKEIPAGTRRLLAAGAVTIILVVCLGARASLARGVVGPHAQAQRFLADEIRRHAGPVTRIAVVNTQETPCLVEPCRGLFGRTAWAVTRAGYPRFFRRAVHEVLGQPGLPVTFVSDADGRPPEPADTLVIDYRRFVQRPPDN